jgi:RNA polymerase sigma-70 factor (ECF subfamily)
MLALLIAAIPIGAVAAQNNTVPLERAVEKQAADWVYENLDEYYYVDNIHTHVVERDIVKSETRYTVAVNCETMLKAKSVTELPFVKGVTDAFNENGLSQTEESVLAEYVASVETDARLGEYSGYSVDIVVAINDKDGAWSLYYQDGMEDTEYPIEVLDIDTDAMYKEGYASAGILFEKLTSGKVRGYSSYNRITARDYALQWIKNPAPTDCYDDGTSCGMYQNRTYWNNSAYTYFSLFKHNDCADFVSQAMSAGGLPEGGTWFRTKNVTTQSWGAAWTSVSSLESYMTNSSHKYWDSSTFALANAGNICLTSSTHVTMITLNDTVTHRYTAHTNDRRDYGFTSTSYTYYTIKTA